MNKQIRHVGVFSALMVFALLANLTYIDLGRQASLEANPYNVRARQAEFDVHRGQILAGDTVIADSIPSTDQSSFSFQRVYANGPLYAPVTGFYSYIYGSSRIENSYNSELVGSSSSQWLQNLIDTTSGRTPQGASVVTTISPTLQQAAAKALQGYDGAIVAMDPHTGAVLAMVTSPSYDPNLLASHDLGAVQTSWQQLTTDPSNPMTDRSTREIYPPGSTFKLIVASAALEKGYTPDTMIDTPSSVQLPGSTSTLSNSSDCGNTQVTLARALQLSCNTAFANLGVSLGASTVRAEAEKFGFDSPHLPEVGGVASTFPATLDNAQLMMSSIGQYDVAATPLQMAMVVSTLVNGGQQADPYLVQEVRAPDLSVLYEHQNKVTPVVSASTAQSMQDMMVQVVANGTGTAARIPGVTVGGKSGTSQTDADNPDYAWFVCYALNPDIVVSVFLQRDEKTPVNLWGGANAAPVAKEVLQASR
ncbi:MAG: penicillin-binding transpeptidase domain-containing protein [Propionibacteriaceae bacterium]|nr:penicillin-binding transpeptidase domain-containing protein [Propionibacteriaceae bacterium]